MVFIILTVIFFLWTPRSIFEQPKVYSNSLFTISNSWIWQWNKTLKDHLCIFSKTGTTSSCKMLRPPDENQLLVLKIAASHILFISYPLHSKLFLQVLSVALCCLQPWKEERMSEDGGHMYRIKDSTGMCSVPKYFCNWVWLAVKAYIWWLKGKCYCCFELPFNIKWAFNTAYITERRCFCFSCHSGSNDRLRFLSFLILYSHRARKQVGSWGEISCMVDKSVHERILTSLT